jgi:hypothetical protein
MIMPLKNLVIVLLFLSTFITFSKALEPNCTEASWQFLWRSDALVMAMVEQYQFYIDMCKSQPYNVCSLTNITAGADAHLRAVVYANSTEAKDVNDKVKTECENAGGQVILETFDIGLMSNIDDIEYYKFEVGDYLPLYDTKYLDIYIAGHVDCIHAYECENLTHVFEYTRYKWGAFFNSFVYNFTLYDIAAFPAERNELNLTCLEAATLLYERNGNALSYSWLALAAFMINMCMTQPNNICSLTNINDAEKVDTHPKLTITMNSTEADEVNNDFREHCTNAGGILVFQSFNFSLLSNTDEIQYYSTEKEEYKPLYNSTSIDVFFTGIAECFGWTECQNSSHVIEVNIYTWETFFNASVYNYTLHQIIWDNYTM